MSQGLTKENISIVNNIFTAGPFLPLSGGTVTGDTLFTLNLSATTFYGDGSNLSGISTANYYTTGATLVGTTAYFDRTDLLSAYTLNLSSISGGTSASLWSASTGTNSIIANNGTGNLASGQYAIAEGNSTISSANSTHSEGQGTQANGIISHAEGYNTQANGIIGHAEGETTIAGGYASHSEGRLTTANGDDSHSEGYLTTSNGTASHSEGISTIASGNYSHAEGNTNQASGNNSHAGGIQSIASGNNSFVHGSGSTASGINTIVLGPNITGITDNTVYVPNLNIGTIGSGVSTINLGIDSTGNVVTGTTGGGTFSGGTVTGDTIFTAGLTANTLTITGSSGFTYTDSSAGANKVLTSDANGNATWQYLPSAGVSIFVFTSGASSISTYKQMVSLSNYSASTLVSYATSVTTTPTLMSVFASNAGYPGVTVIPSGNFHFHVDTEKVAGANNYYIYAELFKINTGGTETFLLSSDTSTQIAVNTVVQQDIHGFSTSAITLSSTDRLVTKFYAVMVSSTATINLRIDDATNAHMEIPSTVDTTNFIPYSGATSDVNLGSHNLTTSGAISATTYYGIPDTFGASFDGQNGVLSTGSSVYRVMTTSGTITGWNIIASPSGTCVFDVWKTTGSTLPTIIDTITASVKPQLTDSYYSASTAVSTWDINFNSGDKIALSLNSVTGITWANLIISYIKNS